MSNASDMAQTDMRQAITKHWVVSIFLIEGLVQDYVSDGITAVLHEVIVMMYHMPYIASSSLNKYKCQFLNNLHWNGYKC